MLPSSCGADHPDVELRVGELEARGDGRRAPVDRMKPVGVHVVREAARAADAGDEHGVLAADPELGEGALERGQDGVVATSWAPSHSLI